MHNIEEAASREVVAGSKRPAYLAALTWLLWLPLLAPMILALLGTHPSALRLALSLLGAAIFAGVYIWTALQNALRVIGAAPSPVRADLRLWLPVLAMLLLSLALTETNGVTWGGLFIFTVAAAMGRLPTRQAAALLMSVALLTLLFGWRRHLPLADSLSNIFWIGLAGLATLTMLWSITTSRRWREEREELARFAAVTQERLRIARDLHDLLGHNLSLIALKSELARRLLEAAPERAAAEIGDVERVARTALREVREAVAGYRQPTLASELHNAREVLAAAGIAYRTEGAGALGTVPAAVEGALAWAVREGVTNVVRHSRARSCTIWLRRAAETVGVEISDDGIGVVGTAGDRDSDAAQARYMGNGLRGVEERVAALGGRSEAGARRGGGFRLAVRVPLAPAALAEEMSGHTAAQMSEPSAREAEATAIERGAPR